MKVTKKMIVFLAGIFLLMVTAVFYNYNKSQTSSVSLKNIQMNELPLPQQNTRVDPNV